LWDVRSCFLQEHKLLLTVGGKTMGAILGIMMMALLPIFDHTGDKPTEHSNDYDDLSTLEQSQPAPVASPVSLKHR
jgi:hypothetical protein